MNDIKIRANAAPWRNAVELSMFQDNGNGDVHFVRELKTEKIDTCTIQEPTTRISMTDAQVLMDDLWASGIRPTEGAGSAGAMSATQKHLEDMRHWSLRRDDSGTTHSRHS